MSAPDIDFIPDRLIAEPVVFRGLTDTEVVSISVIGMVCWLPLMVILLLPFGLGLLGVGVGFGMAIINVLIAGYFLQKLKRRMPDGLHQVYLKKQLQKLGFHFGYIEASQCWDIRRHRMVYKLQRHRGEY